ncbi:deoxycytidylate deaminase [Microbacterium phage IAmGroot]|uniref:Deoxycytidylate deminase n=1 Tax=Microbacterium phage IAmGroot TaxID=2588486 RepID=A0A4Y6EHY8_9CAUD|nr:deoxycytidylate deaminase [Microbacterium phage IAmGroot]
MTKPILYLSGPMTGLPHYNYPVFRDAAAELRANGFDVISPVELDEEAGVDLGNFTEADRRAALARDVAAVTRADGVALLPGWMHSSGARAEVAIANAIPIRAALLTEWLDEAKEAAA